MLEAEVIEAFEPLFRDFLNDVDGTLKEFRREPLRPRQRRRHVVKDVCLLSVTP